MLEGEEWGRYESINKASWREQLPGAGVEAQHRGSENLSNHVPTL